MLYVIVFSGFVLFTFHSVDGMASSLVFFSLRL